MERMGVNYGVYDDYNGSATDSKIILIDGQKDIEKVEAYLEAYCYTNDMEWGYYESARIDYEDNCAYTIGYDESDVITLECEHAGRRQFENGKMDFDDVAEVFVNNPTRALPSWLNPTDGWEKQSCDFESGWYGRNDDPEQILENSGDDFDVIFQIDYVNPFATGFCVWVKERD